MRYKFKDVNLNKASNVCLPGKHHTLITTVCYVICMQCHMTCKQIAAEALHGVGDDWKCASAHAGTEKKRCNEP